MAENAFGIYSIGRSTRANVAKLPAPACICKQTPVTLILHDWNGFLRKRAGEPSAQRAVAFQFCEARALPAMIGPMPGFGDYIFIFVLALILFGPKKMPELARQLGKLMGEFRRPATSSRCRWKKRCARASAPSRRRRSPRWKPPARTAGSQRDCAARYQEPCNYRRRACDCNSRRADHASAGDRCAGRRRMRPSPPTP